MEPKPTLPTLPLNLAMSLGCWLSSAFALQCANAAWPLSNPNSPANPQALQNALAKEAQSRSRELLQGVLRYLDAPYARKITEPPVVWNRGNARLLDYGLNIAKPNAPIALIIPSLINRYYILDLDERRSMARYMAHNGVYPLILDWGAPGKFEHDFDIADYINNILLPAITHLHSLSKQRIALVGYCMGGVLALAASQLAPKKIASLAMLATPWNFHCRAFTPFVVDPSWQKKLESLIASQALMPAEIVQSLFYITDPFVFEQKFRRFAALDPDTAHASDFIALEYWVNDGVPLTAPVARDCLIGWAQNNVLQKNEWKIGGAIINPSKNKLPSLIAIPENDHVVPEDCARALAATMPRAKVIRPGSGHVGMIVGNQAKKELWQPLTEWLVNPSQL